MHEPAAVLGDDADIGAGRDRQGERAAEGRDASQRQVRADAGKWEVGQPRAVAVDHSGEVGGGVRAGGSNAHDAALARHALMADGDVVVAVEIGPGTRAEGDVAVPRRVVGQGVVTHRRVEPSSVVGEHRRATVGGVALAGGVGEHGGEACGRVRDARGIGLECRGAVRGVVGPVRVGA